MATFSLSAAISPSLTVPISSNSKCSVFSVSFPSKNYAGNTLKLEPLSTTNTRVFSAPETLAGSESSAVEVCPFWLLIIYLFIFFLGRVSGVMLVTGPFGC